MAEDGVRFPDELFEFRTYESLEIRGHRTGEQPVWSGGQETAGSNPAVLTCFGVKGNGDPRASGARDSAVRFWPPRL